MRSGSRELAPSGAAPGSLTVNPNSEARLPTVAAATLAYRVDGLARDHHHGE
jgi:hypothetical protein